MQVRTSLLQQMAEKCQPPETYLALEISVLLIRRGKTQNDTGRQKILPNPYAIRVFALFFKSTGLATSPG
jgi:hypothetical protein